MLKKIAATFREYVDTYHYGSISGMLLKYGMIGFIVITVVLLIHMIWSAVCC